MRKKLGISALVISVITVIACIGIWVWAKEKALNVSTS